MFIFNSYLEKDFTRFSTRFSSTDELLQVYYETMKLLEFILRMAKKWSRVIILTIIIEII